VAYRPATWQRRAAFRPSGLFLGLVAAFIGSGWLAWGGYGNARLDVVLFVVSGWLVSLCLHEFGHALTAYRSGDHAVAARGYLTLNPLKYSNVLLSLILPLAFLLIGGIGLPGGAVWIDHGAIRSRLRESLVSLAGPLINVLCLLATAAPFAVGADVFGHPVFYSALAFLGFLQLTAALLNLLPMPGLDGGNALRPWLSPEYQRFFDMIAPWGIVLIFVLLLSPVLNLFFFTIVYGLGDVVGLPRGLIDLGRAFFQFVRF
jgi:Zn-dependent protease